MVKRVNKKNKKGSKNGKGKQPAVGSIQPGFMQVFPLRLNTKLSYADSFYLSGTNLSSTFGSEQVYRLASLYDPDFTNVGHQPYGFDQIIPWYVRYQVKSASIKLTFSDPSKDGMYVAMFVKTLNDPATLVNCTLSQAMERPNVVLKPLNNTGSQVTTITRNIDFASNLGVTHSQYINDWYNTSALVSANPLYTPYLAFAVCDPSASSTAGSVRVTVEIIFNSTFFERITPGQS